MLRILYPILVNSRKIIIDTRKIPAYRKLHLNTFIIIFYNSKTLYNNKKLLLSNIVK